MDCIVEEAELPLSELHVDPDNSRAHGQKNMTSIMGSLRRYGQVERLVVRRANMVIIGGNGRYEAMKALGWTKAKVQLVDIDEKEAAGLSIALNRTGELAEWDTAKLRETIIMLQEDAYPLEDIGFDQEDIDRMMASVDAASSSGEDETKKITENFMILVTCEDEGQQADLLERFAHEGINCKALVS
jgi:ParB-like chromosome segregation protein Spo0J